jgi:hypothetical protein
VAAFIDRVDREVAARVQARLSESAGAQVGRRARRGALVRGLAIGLCAGGLIGVFGIIHARETAPVTRNWTVVVPNKDQRPIFQGRPQVFRAGNGQAKSVRVPGPPAKAEPAPKSVAS